ncbi:MAG TPA: hypothetical protein VMT56_00440 [Candidatus Bathyarchaeia archaeon]|nr:hypothetical protein [Candidatus Bathyarchaeia archaeon]
MSTTMVECVDCGEPVAVDEWALKRGAPVSHGSDECIGNLRSQVADLTRRLEIAEAAGNEAEQALAKVFSICLPITSTADSTTVGMVRRLAEKHAAAERERDALRGRVEALEGALRESAGALGLAAVKFEGVYGDEGALAAAAACRRDGESALALLAAPLAQAQDPVIYPDGRNERAGCGHLTWVPRGAPIPLRCGGATCALAAPAPETKETPDEP